MRGISVLRGKFIKHNDILNTEPKEPEFDRELVEAFSYKNRGSVRLSLGLFLTKDEWERERKELVDKPLP